MKYSTRLASAILAAMLCGFSLWACAVKDDPPVTDDTADTTGTTEVFVTTEAQTTTEAEATTEAPVITVAPTTTEAPITTEAPVTTATPVTEEEPVTTEIPETTAPSTEDTAAPIEPEVLKVHGDYIEVLSKGEVLYDTYSKRDMRFADYHSDIWEIAVADLDSDGNEELALRLSNTTVLILWRAEGKVLGASFRYQSMYRINVNGSFFWNTNSGNTHGCSTLRFTDNGCEIVEHIRTEQGDNGETKYFVNNAPVTKAEYDRASSQHNAESVRWVDWDNASLTPDPNSLLYVGEGGYVMIKGADTVRLPTVGTYLHYDNAPDTEYFISDALQVNEPLASVPLYYGTNSAHSFKSENGKLTVSYNNGEITYALEGKVTALDESGAEHVFDDITSREFSFHYVSPELSYFLHKSYCSCGKLHGLLIKIHRMGEEAEFIAVDPKLSIASLYLDERGVGYATSGGMGAAGSTVYSLYYTSDGGKSFTATENLFYSLKLPCANSTFAYINGKVYAIGDIGNVSDADISHELVDTSAYKYWDFYNGLYGNGRYIECAPYFEGEIGVKAIRVQIGDYLNGGEKGELTEGYAYLISADGGRSWSVYEPPVRSAESSTAEIEYSPKPQPK